MSQQAPLSSRRTYLNWRIAPVLLLAIHLGIRLIFPDPSPIADLVIYNTIAFVIAMSALAAPIFNSRLALICAGIGIAAWAVGSTLSTWQSFYGNEGESGTSLWINSAYTLFYPCLIAALLASTSLQGTLRFTQLLDGVISSLGLSALLAATFINQAMVAFDGSITTIFFTLFFPAGDVVLVALALLHLLLLPKSARNIFFALGACVFAITDIAFLITSATSTYQFASLHDDGWLLGLVLIVESLYLKPKRGSISENMSAISTTLALLLATGILAMSALKPATFKTPVIALAICTVALAFLRMATALHTARSALHNRELALHDELTGLPNRRKFLADLELIETHGEEFIDASVMLIDLDGFKGINDSSGHDAGDQLLRHVSTRFSKALPSTALLARLGGDEFGAIIYGSDEDGIEASQALLASISYPVHLVTGAVQVGASIGRVHNDGEGDLLKRCDEAMYFAKRRGGGGMDWVKGL